MAKLVKYGELWEFENDKEEKASKLLSEGNIKAIKNQLWFEQNRRNNLSVDPQNIQKFIQEEAEIKGAMGALQFLLDNHYDLVRNLEAEKA